MKCTREQTWQVIEVLLPHCKKLRENKIHVNLTDIIKDAAIEIFMIENGLREIPSNLSMDYCNTLISTALLELRTFGFLTFKSNNRCYTQSSL
jgi:hypothetical protein